MIAEARVTFPWSDVNTDQFTIMPVFSESLLPLTASATVLGDALGLVLSWGSFASLPQYRGSRIFSSDWNKTTKGHFRKNTYETVNSKEGPRTPTIL